MNRKNLSRAVVLPAALIWSFSTPAFSQRTGGNTGGNTGGGVVSPGTGNTGTPTNPGINTPGRNTIPPINNPNTTLPTSIERPIYLSGKVVLDDGTPPPDSVTIEKVCNGSPRPAAYTDSKGRFQFELNHPTGVMPDASVSSINDSIYGSNSGSGFPGQSSPQSSYPGRGTMSGEVSLSGCELRAALPGFRSDSVNLALRRSFDNPDVGTIVLHRLGNVDGTTISMTSLLAPKDAHKALDKGRDALKKNKPEDAEKELRKAVEAYPKYAVAWFELGRLQARNLKPEEAMQSFHQAISADAKFVSPYLEMAQIYVNSGKWQDVLTVTDQTIRLNPSDFPVIYLFNAVANYNLKQVDQAEKSAREGQKIDAQHRVPKLEEILAMILSDKGDFDAAAEHLRNYLRISPTAKDADKVRGQLIQIEKLAAAGKESAQPPQ